VIDLFPTPGRVVNVSSRAGLLAKLHSEALKQAFTREDLTLVCDSPLAFLHLASAFPHRAVLQDEVDGLMDKFVSAVGKGTATEEGWPSNTYSVSKMGSFSPNTTTLCAASLTDGTLRC